MIKIVIFEELVYIDNISVSTKTPVKVLEEFDAAYHSHLK